MEISELTCVDKSVEMGKHCAVWPFATICAGTVIGDYSVVGSAVWIGRDVTIGAGTRIQHGAFICSRMIIGDDVFIGPNVTTTDDKWPRVKNRAYVANPPILEDYCNIGAGAVILPGVRIGHHATVGAGAVVTNNVAPHAVVTGCPARERLTL